MPESLLMNCKFAGGAYESFNVSLQTRNRDHYLHQLNERFGC
jgi:hypothetical protein